MPTLSKAVAAMAFSVPGCVHTVVLQVYGATVSAQRTPPFTLNSTFATDTLSEAAAVIVTVSPFGISLPFVGALTATLGGSESEALRGLKYASIPQAR